MVVKMIRCNNCGSVFDDSEMDEIYDPIGEYHGSPAYERICICPNCHSDELDEVRERNENEVLLSYLMDNYFKEDVIEVCVELLGEDRIIDIYNKLSKIPLNEEEEFKEYKASHRWEVV